MFLILMIICVNGVNAIDISDNTTIGNQGTTIYVDSSYSGDNESGTQSNPYKLVSSAVGAAVGGETIFIADGNYTESAKITLAANKPLSFVGESRDGVVLTAGGTGGLFSLMESGSSLSFVNLTFKDIHTTSSNVALKVGGNSELNIADCSFINCDGKYGCMQIYTTSTANIVNCSFLDSKASVTGGAGAIYLSGSGASEYTIRDTVINNTRYTTASGFMYGSVYVDRKSGSLLMDNVTISNSYGAASSVLYVKGKVTVKNSRIVDNVVNLSATGYQGESVFAVHKDNGDLTVEQSVIVNNTSPKNFIYGTVANLPVTLNYNVIYDNSFNESLGFKNDNVVLNANYNWWGTNDRPAYVDVDNWVVMNASYTQNGNDVVVLADFTKYTSGSENNTLEKQISSVPVSFTSTSGSLDCIVSTVGGVASASYTVDGNDKVTVKSASETQVLNIAGEVSNIIYVNSSYTGDVELGTKSNPYKLVSSAVGAAVGGETIFIADGNYTESAKITLAANKPLSFVGESRDGVVLTAGGTGGLFSLMESGSSLSFVNLTFKDIHTTSSNVALKVGGNSELNIADCSFINCDGKYGCMQIYTTSTANIVNCSFLDSKASVTGGAGAIYLSGSGASEYTIRDTVINNTRYTTASGFMYGSVYVDRKSGSLLMDNVTISNSYGAASSVLYVKGKVTVKNSRIVDNVVNLSATGYQGESVFAVHKDNGDLTVEQSVIVNNTSPKNFIYGTVANLPVTLNYNVIYDNSFNESLGFKNDNVVLNANYNWWGTNDKPAYVDVDNWVIMGASYSPTTAKVGDEITISVDFTKYKTTDGQSGDLTKNIPDGVAVQLTSTSGKLDETLIVKNGVASIRYTIDQNDYNITVSSSDAEINLALLTPVPSILYVSPKGNDNNVGTRDSPLATLSHAIDITETGNIVLLEGIHNVNGLTIDKTLNITGEGNVTIDATNTNRIMYIYSAGDVTFHNVEMINGYSSESGALIGNTGKLTLINTTLSNSISNNNGGAVYNVGTLTIINSIFENNCANLGGAIYSGGNSKSELNIRIINTTFVDNTALGNSNNKGGGAIYAQASSGNFILENVTFENNNAGKYGGGALYAMQLDNIRISDSKFINNTAESNEYYGGGAIAIIGGNYQREGTTTITNTLFENNDADMCGGAIYLKGTTLDISNSVLVNSIDANGIVISSMPTSNGINSKITANDNWWGSNDDPKNLITKVSTVTLNRWAILTIENDTEIAEGNDVNIVVSLTNYTTGSENGTLSKPITIKRNVTVQTSSEEFNGVLDNGTYNISYHIPAGLKLISATVDGQTVVLYVVESQAYIILDNVTGKKGSKVNITTKIITSDSQIVNDGYINFYVDSKLIGHADVLNNNATLIYLIKENEGIYNLTAEYISASGAFNASNATVMLNVSGLNNIVREDNFYEFFDSDGVILDDIVFDELIFEGEFNNVSKIITIDNPIKITGDDAVLNNIVFMVMADDVELNNITFNTNQQYISNYGSIFLVTSNNVSLINNKVNYTALGTDAYVIYADEANGLKVINNDITFANEFNAENIFTNAIYIHDSNNVLMKNNKMDITIPSVDIDYVLEKVFSEGVVLDNCDNAIISDNEIHVKYNSVIGNLDTLRGVDIKGCYNPTLANNTITAEGHKYVYAVVIDGIDFNLYNNNISSSSDINYANGININGPASGILKSNTVSTIAPNASYPIYSSGYTGIVNAIYENNTVYGNANDVYGIYVSGTNENLTGNEVSLTGNFTIGIASLSPNVLMSNNSIHSLGSNIGKAWSKDVIPCETSGITSTVGNCIIYGNSIYTTGNYTVNIQNGQVINNYLVANNTYGDKSVYSKDSILIENNTPLMKTANLTVDDISVNVGDEIIFNVTLTDVDNNPLVNYTVDLYVNGTKYHANTDIGGIATFKIDSLPEGIYEMEFIVDNKNIMELIEESAILNITLNDLNVNVTSCNISEGEDLIINATVPDNLKENLIIEINNSTYLIKKSDSITISNLSAGKYPITVYYPGDDYYKEYNDEFNVTVFEKDKIVVNINEPSEGEDLIINVNGPKDITGNVIISVGNQTFDVPFVDGDANVTISNISEGFYPIDINYQGDEKYSPYTFEGNVTVNPKLDVIVVADNVTKYYKGSERFIVKVYDLDLNPIANKSVNITINGITYTRFTDESGITSIPLGLNSGQYDVISKVDNTVANSVVTILSTVDGSDIVKMYRNGTQYYATFIDTNGKYLADGTDVKFNINGILYIRKVTGDKGQAGLNINLPQGEYIITAINPVNGEMHANNITVLPNIVDNKDIIKYYKNGTQYSVKLLGDDGKAVGAGEKVTFNVNGIFYTRQTDASGIATLNINLPPNDYIITADYKGCRVANNITVLQVLNAEDITMKYRDGTQFVATLVNGQGKPYANQAVTFNINGVFYSRITDSSGQAKLNINLLAGEYIITSSYNGSNIANTITITA